jgi:hypothetical protein
MPLEPSKEIRAKWHEKLQPHLVDLVGMREKLEAIAMTLDTEKVECAACHTKHHRNWAETLLHRQLLSLAQKVKHLGEVR